MEKYKNIFIKICIIIILIIIATLLNKRTSYVPKEELPINSYYTEDEWDYNTIYREKILNQFIAYIKTSDYTGIYSMLSQECKNTKFNTESDFYDYIQITYPRYIDIKDTDKLNFIYLDYNEFNNVQDTKKYTILINITDEDVDELIPAMKITIIDNGPYDMKIEF